MTLWPAPVIDFLFGRISAESLLAEAKKRRWPNEQQDAECTALYFIGMDHLLAGRRADALHYFRRCVATGMESSIEYDLARLELKSLQVGQGK